MATPLIVLYGGLWCNGRYNGGTKVYIPIPKEGLSFQELLEKIGDRLEKDTNRFSFEIISLVQVDEGELIKMKVTNNFEWSALMDMPQFPTIYVSAFPKFKAPSPPYSKEIVVVQQPSLPNSNSLLRSNNRLDTIFNAATHYSSSRVVDPLPISTEPNITGNIEFGSIFMKKETMISAVHSYHLKKFAEFRTVVSSPIRYILQCKFPLTCVFCLKSKSVGCSWRIYKVVDHTCMSDLRMASEPTASSRAVAEFILPNMAEDGFVFRPREFWRKIEISNCIGWKEMSPESYLWRSSQVISG